MCFLRAVKCPEQSEILQQQIVKFILILSVSVQVPPSPPLLTLQLTTWVPQFITALMAPSLSLFIITLFITPSPPPPQ